MARKPKKGYFVRGQFVAEGSELDEQYRRALKGGDAPSKTELKAQSAQLQALGEALLTLRPALREALALPARLEEALTELARITDFEGRRRQSQYVGKLMRQLDEDGIAAIHAALEQQRQGAAQDTLLLHAAEDWRERLAAPDAAASQAALNEWMARFAQTDAQQLRALIRQARKDRAQAAAVASAPRTGRSSPESDSSPANSQPASLRPSIWPLAARMPSAMGRSKRPESLGKSAGARLTVMRWLCGNCRPLLSKALRTRSRASFTSTSARPTSVKAGRPLAKCASTATAGAASPIRARPCTRLNPMLGSLPFFAGLFDYENNSCPGASGSKGPRKLNIERRGTPVLNAWDWPFHERAFSAPA